MGLVHILDGGYTYSMCIGKGQCWHRQWCVSLHPRVGALMKTKTVVVIVIVVLVLCVVYALSSRKQPVINNTPVVAEQEK
jgi:hypothetical protein